MKTMSSCCMVAIVTRTVRERTCFGGVSTCCSLCFHRVVLFQELLSRRTSIPLHNQELLYEGRRLVLDPNRQAKTFPKTSRDNPIMLVSHDSVATVGLIFEDRRSLPAPSQH